MVYYRKYRPQTIDELDSSSLRETLNSVFLPSFKEDKKKHQFNLAGDIPHAFMFTGPKGLGKTSTARIVSKVINCVEIKINGKSIILCDNHCEPCKTIANGTNLDVLEIDGASNRGIDEVRDLREKVRLSPVSNHKKIYIIDEVHMLTTEAFNALLKTIEEPPSHVVFIFCTTEAHKVPATIYSRCFNVPFTIATSDELCRSFERIVKGEKLKVDEGVLPLIANMSDGSFRDGAKVLEELALLTSGTPITTKIVEEKYHITSIPIHVTSLLTAFAKHDTKAAIQLVATLSEQGIDTRYFLQQVLNQLHRMVLINLGIESGSLQSPLSLTDIQMLVQLLSKAYKDTKSAAIEQLPLELAIIGFTSKQSSVQDSSIQKQPDYQPSRSNAQRISYPSPQPFGSTQGKSSPSISTRLSTPHPNPLPQRGREIKEEKSQLGEEDQGQVIHMERVVVTGDPQKVDKLMDLLITKTKVVNQSLAGILRGCQIKQYDGKTLVIEAKYKFHKDRLDDGASQLLLQQVIEEIAGNKVAVSVLLKE